MKTDLITRYEVSYDEIRELICKHVNTQTGSDIEPHGVEISRTATGLLIEVKSNKIRQITSGLKYLKNMFFHK